MEQKISLVQTAYQIIKENIISGVYTPGQLLYETDLAEGLGMSRQPIHQAIQRLYEEGWLSSVARRNIRVQDICLDNIEEVYCIRKVLERSALTEIFEKQIYWQASFQLEECLLHMQENINNYTMFRKWHYEFYARMLKAFGSPKLEKLYVRSGMEQILRINLLIHGEDSSQHFAKIIEETKQLISFIRENRAEQADALYMKMWKDGRNRLEQQLTRHKKTKGGKTSL